MGTEVIYSKLDEPVDTEENVYKDLTAPLVLLDGLDSKASVSIKWRKLLTVVPSLLLLLVAVSLTVPADTTHHLANTYRHMGYNDSTFSLLEDRGLEIQTLVEGTASKWEMTRMVFEAFVPALLTLFAGLSKDKSGRRTFLLLLVLSYAGTYAAPGRAGSILAAAQQTSGCPGCANCINCTNCTNCINCTNCTNCTDCTDCHDCNGCTNCTRSDNCVDSTNLTDCTDCTDCHICTRCQNCTGSKNCTDCKKCKNCTDCTNCISCRKCANCVGCTKCTNCSGVVGCSDIDGCTGCTCGG